MKKQYAKPQHYCLFLALFSLILSNVTAQNNITAFEMPLQKLADSNQKAELITLTKTPGNHDLQVLKLGDFNPGQPAIFVAANLPGNLPMATEGALWLANYLLKQEATQIANWYILPTGNPDAYHHYFNQIQWDSPCNDSKVNNDKDEQTDEDGPEDLNNDGFITQMLVVDPEGEYIKDTTDQRLIRKANPDKGEKGKYKLYTEGIDNDGDGLYNEDPLGGVNINRNFTYQFESFIPENGKWNGSEVETYALMKFFSEHPEIAMSIVIGESNNLLFPGQNDKKEETQKIKVPENYAERLGIDKNKSYSAEELKAKISENTEDQEQGLRILKSILNTTAPTKIEEEDLGFYQEISREFKSYLKNQKRSTDYEKTSDWGNGSFEKYSYFEYGLPTFCINLWPIPKQKKDSLKSKEIKPLPLQSFLSYADSNGMNVFVNWQEMKLPDFTSVEIGGIRPYATSMAPFDSMNTLFEKQLPFVLVLAKKLPEFSISSKVTPKNEDLIQVDVFVTNNGALPYPTAMGYRNEKPAPVVMILRGDVSLLAGKERTPVGRLNSMETKKITFLMNKKKSESINIELETKNVKRSQPTLTIQL